MLRLGVMPRDLAARASSLVDAQIARKHAIQGCAPEERPVQIHNVARECRT